MTKPNLIEEISERATPTKLAQACGVDRRAVKFWREKGELPKTEWTGETSYCQAIESLMADSVRPVTRAQILANQTHQLAEGAVYRLPVELLRRDPNQPRRQFDPEELQELADMLETDGQETPITFRVGNDREGAPLVIVHGERRWRASQIANLNSINGVLDTREESTPGERVFRQIADNTGKPLSAWDWSCTTAYLHDELDLTDQQISDELTKRGFKGFSRPAVANLRRLQKLPEYAKNMIMDEWLTPAHGKYLLAIKDDKARSIVIEFLSKSRNAGGGAPTIDDMNQIASNVYRKNYIDLEAHNPSIGGWPCIEVETDCKGCQKLITSGDDRYCKDQQCFLSKHEEGKKARQKAHEQQRVEEEKQEQVINEELEKMEADPEYRPADTDLQNEVVAARKQREADKQREAREALFDDYKNRVKAAVLADPNATLAIAAFDTFEFNADGELEFRQLLNQLRAGGDDMLRKMADDEINGWTLHWQDFCQEVGVALEVEPPEGLGEAG